MKGSTDLATHVPLVHCEFLTLTTFHLQTLGLEYRNYLEEVVKVLEEDPRFKVILDNATSQEIQVSVCIKS